MLRDDGKDIAAIVSSPRVRAILPGKVGQVDAVSLSLTAMNELAAEAAANGLTEEKLAELLKQPD